MAHMHHSPICLIVEQLCRVNINKDKLVETRGEPRQLKTGELPGFSYRDRVWRPSEDKGYLEKGNYASK